MKIIKDKITIDELREMSKKMFGNLVKVVVDIEKKVIAVDGELHSDEAELLIKSGSKGENLWGINIYPDIDTEDWLEFDSLINLKPNLANKTRGVEDPSVRQRITKLVNKFIKR